MSKKVLSIFVLVLTLAFSTQAFASLTFTTDAITGTTTSSIDLGSGNALSLQTTGNGVINLGSGLLTSLGGATFSGTVKGLNVYENVGNLALGSEALNRTTTGSENTVIGFQTLFSNTSGSSNTANGAYALYSNTTGGSNTAIGWSSLGYSTTGSSNTAIGSNSLGVGTVTGNYNTANGALALGGNTTGSSNTAIGASAGWKSGATPATANAVTIGSNLTFLGYQSGLGSTTQRTNSTAIGNEAYVDADNTVVLGDENVVDVFAGSTKQAKVSAKGIQLTTGTKPTCDATTRGTVWYVAGGTGVADTSEMCRKDAGDAYAWVALY